VGFVFLCRNITAATFNSKFHFQAYAWIAVKNHQIRIQYLETIYKFAYIASGELISTAEMNSDFFAIVVVKLLFEAYLLQVQYDFSNVFNNAFNSAELMVNPFDPQAGDRKTFQ